MGFNLRFKELIFNVTCKKFTSYNLNILLNELENGSLCAFRNFTEVGKQIIAVCNLHPYNISQLKHKPILSYFIPEVHKTSLLSASRCVF